jgi:hypothetical protein
MIKREWVLIGIIVLLCVVIVGCSAPVKAGSQSNVVIKWLDEITDGSIVGYQTFSEIDIPERNVTCFVARSGNNGVAMQCFKNSDIYNGDQ